LFVLVVASFSGAASAQGGSNPAATAKEEAPLSNKDVMKLTKLGLGDDVVIAKIKQAAVIDFDLTTDGLVQLKQSSVSSRVIAAMLERTTPRAAVLPDLATTAPNTGTDNFGQDIRLIVKEKEVRLPSSRGDLSATGFWPVVMTFLDYPGLHARTRTTNVRPTLIIRSEHDPSGYYYLGRLDVNDEEDNNRSLKIEQKEGAFSATTRVVPAGRWHVDYDATEPSPGIWHVVPRRDLTPGEYGIVVPGGVLYEFGID
jgi:hypothetical protein